MNLFRSATLLALASLALSAHAALFDFESVPVGTGTDFADTDDGLTARFVTPLGTGEYGVLDTPALGFTVLQGRALYSGFESVPLGIALSAPRSSFTTSFALNREDTLTLTAYLGINVVGTSTATGAVLGAPGFYEGSIGFAGAPFDAIVLATASAGLAIDNVSVQAVPEPAGMAALGVGVVALLRRRKRA